MFTKAHVTCTDQLVRYELEHEAITAEKDKFKFFVDLAKFFLGLPMIKNGVRIK